MKKNESNLTSLISAFGRAYHSKFDSPKIFDDFIAKDLISQKEIHKLLAKIPSGSSIVFDNADDKLFEEKGMSNRVQNMVQMASASGEPMKSCFSYDEIEKMLENSGLLIYEHLSPVDIYNQFFSNHTDYLSAFETIHYIHAVKK